MHNLSEDESAFSAISRLPIAPFSSFLNDLNRPFFLNNLQPSGEIIRSGVNFPDSIQAPEKIPQELFDCSSFNPCSIELNNSPVKEVSHEYDDFMLKVLEQCYEIQLVNIKESHMTVTNPNSTPLKSNASKALKANAISTPNPNCLKIKLNVAGMANNTGQILKKLVQEESFVNPLCFDCEGDLIQISRVIKTFSISPPKSIDLELIESIHSLLFKYVEEFFEYIDQSHESIDSIKANYCLSLIGLLNISRLSSKEVLKDYNSFDQVMRLFSLCNSDSSDLIMSAVIESFISLLNKFKIQDVQISSYCSHLLNLCFDTTGTLSKIRISSIIALAQVFTKYSEYRTYLIDQLLMRLSDSENVDIQKMAISMIISCLQGLCLAEEPANKTNLVTSFLTYCLNYFWKGEGKGTEIPKSSPAFFIMMEELQVIYSDWHWPIASSALNQCTIQMFHYLLKDDAVIGSNANVKSSLLLKLRFLDVLANIAKTLYIASEYSDKRSIWDYMTQNSWFDTVLSPKNSIESLSLSSAIIEPITSECFFALLHSGPLGKIPERVVGLFVKLISSEIIQLRSKAIKNLFNLMNSAHICKTNYEALKANVLIKASDSSISVRDAVLEFISKLIFTSLPHETDTSDLIESVLARIKDRGVSVRKRAVKIIGEILQKEKEFSKGNEKLIKFKCISGLISHISEEDDEIVIEMIFKTLKDQWILNFLGKDFLNMTLMAQRKIMATFAEEVVQIIDYLHSNLKFLQDFLARLMTDKSIEKDYLVFFAGTIEVLLENLLQSLERNDSKNLKCSLESISLFSESNPQSLENHLGLLQSLLRSDDCEISFLSVKLMSGVIPVASLAELKKLQDLEKDLLGIIYRGSELAVKLSIETLYHYVNNCSHQYSILSSLWQKFTEYLKARMNDHEIDSSSVPHVCRALLATGVLCAQSALHRVKEFGLKDFHNGAQARCLFEFVGFFSKVSFPFVQSCSIQAFGSLLIASPQISVSSFQLVRYLINSALSGTENNGCKVKMLVIFDQMIRSFNPDSTNYTNKENTKRDILSMEGEESYFSSLIQEHLNLVSNCVISCETLEIHSIALKICSTSAILGLINPQLIVPYLAIGLNSENDQIQGYSRTSYEKLMTRFPSMISKDLILPSKLLFRQCKLKQNSQNSLISGFYESSSQAQISRLSFYYSTLNSNPNSKAKNSKISIEILNGVFSWFERIITKRVGPEHEDFKFILNHDSDNSDEKITNNEIDSKKKYFELEEFIYFLIGLIGTLPFSNSDEIINCLQKVQGIFSILSENLESEFVELAEEFIKIQFAILKGLSYVCNYLIKSYPQLIGMSINLDDEQQQFSSKTLQRNSLIQFELPKIEKIENISISELHEFISNPPSIPILLNQQQQINNKKRLSQNFTLKNKGKFDDVDIDEDISNFLVDDDEISSSSSSDFDEDETEILELKKNPKLVKKKSRVINKKKKTCKK